MIPTRRDLDFQLPASSAGHWHEAGAVLTHFINAMSLTFPEGERFFIHSVRHFRDRITDPALRQAVTAFIGQEAMHGREHEAYNARLAEAGLPVQALEAAVARFFRLLENRLPPAAQLSITIAQEHYTAIVADLLLEHPELVAGAPPKLAALWKWHALEEIEHKAVAFDVYEMAMGRGAGAYALRAGSMLATTAGFFAMVLACQGAMIAADRRPGGRRGTRGFLRFLLDPRAGLVRRLARPWADYFRPAFHPWQHDNRARLRDMDTVVALVTGSKPRAEMRQAA